MNIIAYYRVSTKRQGRSGLGLEAQQNSVVQFGRQGAGRVLAEYVEIESGKKSDRPELAKALSHAKLSKATLVVAKLDRLSRNVAFLSALMESRVQFVCVDNPHATPLTVHILAAVAEAEAKAISERTTAALQAARRRGTLLGSARPGFWDQPERREARARGAHLGGKVAAESHRRAANEVYGHLYQRLAEMRGGGMSLRQIARALTGEGQMTRRGCPWSASQVLLVLERGAALRTKAN